MDRSEKFKKRLANKLNLLINQDGLGPHRIFDPTPYVDIMMDKIYWEDPVELDDSIDDIPTNPEFDFILGRTSLLNLNQKQLVVKALERRLNAIVNFDPSVLANELVDLQDTPEFDQYIDEDDEDGYDFTTFFDKHRLTKEQRQMVSEFFYEQIRGDGEEHYDERAAGIEKIRQAIEPQNKFFVYSIILFLLAIIAVPPFFIPNYLQRIGWLSADTGWFFKIFIGGISAFILFKIVATIFNMLVNKALKNLQK